MKVLNFVIIITIISIVIGGCFEALSSKNSEPHTVYMYAENKEKRSPMATVRNVKLGDDVEISFEVEDKALITDPPYKLMVSDNGINFTQKSIIWVEEGKTLYTYKFKW